MHDWVEFLYPMHLHANEVSGFVMQRVDVAFRNGGIYDVKRPFGLGIHPSRSKAMHGCVVTVRTVQHNSEAVYPLLYKMFLVMQSLQLCDEFQLKESVGLYAINDAIVNGDSYEKTIDKLIACMNTLAEKPVRITFQRIMSSTMAPMSGFVIAKDRHWSVSPFSTPGLQTSDWFAKIAEFNDIVVYSDSSNEYWKEAESKTEFKILIPKTQVEPKETLLHPKYGILEIIASASPRMQPRRLFQPARV